jgi:hypothetical protein
LGAAWVRVLNTVTVLGERIGTQSELVIQIPFTREKFAKASAKALAAAD